MAGLAPLFEPESVAVIGATEREGSVGRTIVANLDRSFEGTIVPVNPNYESVLGYPCVDHIDQAPAVDLGVIVVPADAVLEVIEDLAAADVRHIVVISAGFSETDTGSQRERELVRLADTHDLEIIGPNSLGVLSTASGLNATFAPGYPPAGSISMLSQSGAFITSVLDMAEEYALGFRHIVSLGNEAVVDETDVLSAWADDEETHVVMGYLEGIDDGQRFIETVRDVTADTPIVLVKSGRTEAGSRAASSHTGSIAGNDTAYEAGLEQAGVIRVETLGELIDATRALGSLAPMDGEGIGVITNAGGPGVMATDAIGASDLQLSRLSDGSLDRLDTALPAGAGIYNPVDILGDARADRFGEAVDIALDDPGVDGVLVVAAPTGVMDFQRVADRLIAIREQTETPIVVCAMGAGSTDAGAARLAASGIPTYRDPARAVFGLAALARQGDIVEREYQSPRSFAVDVEAAREIIDAAVARDRTQLGLDGLALLEAYGIDTPPGGIAHNPAEAEGLVAGFDGTAAMKLISPSITHKSDIGAVALDVAEEEVRSAYERIVTNAQQYQADAHVIGVYVQEMLDLEDDTETIVGGVRDPQFGPMVLFGLGGIFVEVLADTEVRIAPLSEREAEELVFGIDAAPLLQGARGRPPADTDAIVETLQRLSQLMSDHPRLLELDVNPLVAGAEGVRAIDFRATIDTEEA